MRQLHAPRLNEQDMRPGWVRDQDAGIPLNTQQVYAAQSRGFFRVPNAMTLAGIALNFVGASYVERAQPVKATTALAFSFLCDAEGLYARRFGVDDPLGGGRSDQGADFIKASITMASLLRKHIFPRTAAALTYGPKVANAAIGTYVARKTGKTLQSSANGKKAECIRDIAPVAFLAASAAEKAGYARTAKVFRAFGWVNAAASFIVGINATAGYAREAATTLRRAHDC